jgi:uncharacterized protein YecT (DUF1311 family)
MRILITLLAVAHLTHAIPAWSENFDCSKASTNVEIAICDDPELSALDELIAISYSASRNISHNKDSLSNTQKKWLMERDKVSGKVDNLPLYSNGNLYVFMLKRLRVLFEETIGSNYDEILNLFSKSRSIKFEVENSKRVLLFTQSKPYGGGYHNALFFDTDDKLVKVFIGEAHGFESVCESAYLFEGTNDKIADLSYKMHCGLNGRPGWEKITYELAPKCIQFKNIQRQYKFDSSIAYVWTLSENKEICLEEQNYNPGTDGLLFGRRESEKPNSFAGLLAFFTDYWLEPPVENVGPEFEGCGASSERLTDVKLINLYTILSNSGTLLNGNIKNIPTDTGFVGYTGIRDSSYADMIDDYEKNKKIYDLFLPVLKILDTDDALKDWVSVILRDYYNGIPSSLDGYNVCETFKVINGDFRRYTYFRKYGFWNRRELDGTTDQTLEILRKLQNILANE